MAMELFGADIGPLAAIGCVTAYLFSGHTGIYHSQRVGHGKYRRGEQVVKIAGLTSRLRRIVQWQETPPSSQTQESNDERMQ